MGKHGSEFGLFKYRDTQIMIVACAMLIGAMTSAAWVAPRPYCDFISFVAWLLFVWIRRAQ